MILRNFLNYLAIQLVEVSIHTWKTVVIDEQFQKPIEKKYKYNNLPFTYLYFIAFKIYIYLK